MQPPHTCFYRQLFSRHRHTSHQMGSSFFSYRMPLAGKFSSLATCSGCLEHDNTPFGYMAVSQNQWYHFGVGAPPILVYFSWDWDFHWGYGLLTHGHMIAFLCSETTRQNASATVVLRYQVAASRIFKEKHNDKVFGANPVLRPIQIDPSPTKSPRGYFDQFPPSAGGVRWVLMQTPKVVFHIPDDPIK